MVPRDERLLQAGTRYEFARFWMRIVAFALDLHRHVVHYSFQAAEASVDLNFRVERWTKNGQTVEKVLAVCDDIVAARGAFAAVAEWPDKRFTLRQGIRVLDEHPPPKQHL
jgi:hypothetical protein